MEKICCTFLNDAPCCLVDNMTAQITVQFEKGAPPSLLLYVQFTGHSLVHLVELLQWWKLSKAMYMLKLVESSNMAYLEHNHSLRKIDSLEHALMKVI